jgi:hypothetical protein
MNARTGNVIGICSSARRFRSFRLSFCRSLALKRPRFYMPPHRSDLTTAYYTSLEGRLSAFGWLPRPLFNNVRAHHPRSRIQIPSASSACTSNDYNFVYTCGRTSSRPVARFVFAKIITTARREPLLP